MNIVYKFTSSKSGKFYIGSKAECEVLDGTIYCLKNRGKYYSSSSAKEFWEEVSEGNMVLEVLEVVPDRDTLLEREAFYQLQVDAKNNPNCYNLCIATDIRNVVTTQKWNTIVNMYNETLIDKSKNASAVARLNLAAVKEGFKNYGHKVYEYLISYRELRSYKKVDLKYGRVGYSRRFLAGKSIEDFEKTLDICKIQEHLLNGASFLKACELEGALDYVVVYQHGFDKCTSTDIRLKISNVNGFETREAFNKEVLRMYLRGYSMTDITKMYSNISLSSVARIIQEEVIKRLDINDIQ